MSVHLVLILLGKLDDFLEFLGTLGPDEWATGFVISVHIVFEKPDEFPIRPVNRLLKALSCHNGEEALRQIYPTRVCWGVVK